MLRGKSYIFIKTWNRTYAMELGFKILTDGIMNLIEKKMGIPKEQQRLQVNNSRQEKHSNNITSKRTISLTCHFNSTEATGTKTDPTAEAFAETEERQEKPKRKAEASFDLPETGA